MINYIENTINNRIDTFNNGFVFNCGLIVDTINTMTVTSPEDLVL